MNEFYFHGLLKTGTDRVRVRVVDLDCFIQCAHSKRAQVFFEIIRDGEWHAGGEIAREDIVFDHCNPLHDER